MLAQGFLQLGLQGRRGLLQGVGQGGEEAGEFLAGPIEDVAGEEAATGAEFEDFDLRSAVERLPYLVELAREQASEDGVNVAGGVEVSGFAELVGVAGIVALDRMVEAKLHVAGKRDWAVVANFLFDLLAEGQSRDPCGIGRLKSKT
jgi:hypothetical protein